MERLKKLLADMVADQDKLIREGRYRELVSHLDQIKGVRSAIAAIKESCNTQIQTDAAKHCAESQRCMGFLTTGESLCGGCKLHR